MSTSTGKEVPSYKSTTGRYLTESLFYETSRGTASSDPVFTLKDEDHKGHVSMKRLYLEIGDPSEFEFAKRVLGSWQHWQLLTGLSWFKPHVQEWRDELMSQLRSKAAAAAIEILADPEANASTKMQASRYITSRGWEDQPTKGRPTKKQVKQEARAMAESDRDLEDDYRRILN